MLSALAVNWVLLVLRAGIAMSFAILVLVWPGLMPSKLVLLFGGYAFVDGILALIVAFGGTGQPGFGSALFEALIRILFGTFALVAPARAALSLRDVVAVWALFSGLAAIWAALVLRRDLTGEWPLPLAGAVSMLAGAALFFGFAPPELVWLLGPYTALFGATLLALALRLRQIAAEIPAAHFERP